ncbi:hypothetical protein ACHAW5_008276 [Stephanodiscus triporus]|uniref:Ribosomal RNA small subunit methyltransferase G n=1 Tax=Stephanodiscus triporus TaxID=2934178 RepID=A0ABD3MNP0_9STRA
MKTTIMSMAFVILFSSSNNARRHAAMMRPSFVVAFSGIVVPGPSSSSSSSSSSSRRRQLRQPPPRPMTTTTTIVIAESSSSSSSSSCRSSRRSSSFPPIGLRSTTTTGEGDYDHDDDALASVDDIDKDIDLDDIDEDDIGDVDPYSSEAKGDLCKFYEHHGLGDPDDARVAYVKLIRLTELVLSWNERLNLVSRRDCTASVVYNRHVLPSVALLPLIVGGDNTRMATMSLSMSNDDDETSSSSYRNNNNYNNTTTTTNDVVVEVVDVGTGGGFPGLPLAMLLPHLHFTLVDSVKKKLVAVSEMISDLDLSNVRVHCGRVESMGGRDHLGRYDVILGRSVTALPRFCGWVSHLVRRERRKVEGKEECYGDEGDGEGGGTTTTRWGGAGKESVVVGGGSGGGRLIYIIGGELDDVVRSRVVRDVPIDELLVRRRSTSDKRALVFGARDVIEIARLSGGGAEEGGGAARREGRGPATTPPRPRRPFSPGRGKGLAERGGRTRNVVGGDNVVGGGKNDKPARGAWSERRNDVKKQRGYDNFRRYES